MVTVSDFNRGLAGGNTGARSSNNNKNKSSDSNKGSRAKGILASIGFRGRDVDESVDKKADKIQCTGRT